MGMPHKTWQSMGTDFIIEELILRIIVLYISSFYSMAKPNAKTNVCNNYSHDSLDYISQ